MRAEILYRPSYSMAIVDLAPHEEIRVEAGAMVSMTEGMKLKTRMEGGLLGSLTRSVLGGESFFLNVFQAPAQGGQINLAPTMPGDMMILEMHGESPLVQGGSFVASSLASPLTPNGVARRRSLPRKGWSRQRAARVCSSCPATEPSTPLTWPPPALHDRYWAPGLVQRGHGLRARAAGGIRSTLLSGEGLVVDLTGPGRVYMQTRSEDAFLAWLSPPCALARPQG